MRSHLRERHSREFERYQESRWQGKKVQFTITHLVKKVGISALNQQQQKNQCRGRPNGSAG